MDLKELASKAIKGELDLTFEHHPVHSFVDGSTEIQDNLLAFKGIAGFFVLDTGSGLVMLDAGHIIDIERAYEEIRKWRPNEPLVAAIFTHHHVDHIFAVEKFDEEALSDGNDRPTVYANKTQNVFSRFGSANHKEKVEITKKTENNRIHGFLF